MVNPSALSSLAFERMGVSDWEVWGSDNALRSVHVFLAGSTAEQAAQMAIYRARAKYGRAENLARWRFHVVEQNIPGPVLHFRADAADHAVAINT
jgi:hypothetical protein